MHNGTTKTIAGLFFKAVRGGVTFINRIAHLMLLSLLRSNIHGMNTRQL